MAKTILLMEMLMGVTLLVGYVPGARETLSGAWYLPIFCSHSEPGADHCIHAAGIPVWNHAGSVNAPGRTLFALTTTHAILGFAAEMLGLYIVLVAGTNLLPRSLRFSKYKCWMRTELVL